MFRQLRVPLFGLALLTWVASNAGAGQDRAPADASAAAPSVQAPPPPAARPVPANPPGLLGRSLEWVTAKIEDHGESARSRTGSASRRASMVPGAGALTGGVRYRLALAGGDARWDNEVAASTRLYKSVRSSFAGPGWFNARVRLGGETAYQDAPQISFFGIGMNATAADRTDYRLRTTEASGIVELRAGGFTAGARAGWIGARGVEPGTSRLAPPIGDRFDDARTPGLADPVRYAHTGAYIELDRLDSRRYPTSGGLYRLELTRFRRLGGAEGRIGQLEADATQFLALPRRNAGFVLRARATLSRPTPGTDVPFYLMPTLGGDSSLRGYADYRFRDRHAAFVSVEYRYPVVRMVDAALFADAGTVAPTLAAFGRTPIARSYGVGLRFHSETKSIFRVDLAHGAEGFRVHVGTTTTIGELRRHLVPYVHSPAVRGSAGERFSRDGPAPQLGAGSLQE